MHACACSNAEMKKANSSRRFASFASSVPKVSWVSMEYIQTYSVLTHSRQLTPPPPETAGNGRRICERLEGISGVTVS